MVAGLVAAHALGDLLAGGDGLRGADHRFGLLGAAALAEREGEIEVERAVARAELLGALEMRHREIVRGQPQVRFAQREVRIGEVGLAFERLAQRQHRLLERIAAAFARGLVRAQLAELELGAPEAEPRFVVVADLHGHALERFAGLAVVLLGALGILRRQRRLDAAELVPGVEQRPVGGHRAAQAGLRAAQVVRGERDAAVEQVERRRDVLGGAFLGERQELLGARGIRDREGRAGRGVVDPALRVLVAGEALGDGETLVHALEPRQRLDREAGGVVVGRALRVGEAEVDGLLRGGQGAGVVLAVEAQPGELAMAGRPIGEALGDRGELRLGVGGAALDRLLDRRPLVARRRGGGGQRHARHDEEEERTDGSAHRGSWGAGLGVGAGSAAAR